MICATLSVPCPFTIKLATEFATGESPQCSLDYRVSSGCISPMQHHAYLPYPAVLVSIGDGEVQGCGDRGADDWVNGVAVPIGIVAGESMVGGCWLVSESE